jgi:NhaP-type Na+/H+ or K+/H+ antiporter
MSFNNIFIIGALVFFGFLIGELFSKIRLPRVTGYLLGGIVFNLLFGRFIPPDFFDKTSLITDISLAIITFVIGLALSFKQIKLLGRSVLWIAVIQAEFAFFLVFAGFMVLLPLLYANQPALLPLVLPLALIFGAHALPTDPAAVLGVMHEYRSKGPVSSTILEVSALDDVLTFINYSVIIEICAAYIAHKSGNTGVIIIKSLGIIGLSVICGAVLGTVFNLVSWFIKKEGEGILIVLLLGLLCLCFGTAKLLGINELLTSMIMGMTVVNFNPLRGRIVKILDRYTEELIFVLFFTLTGMQMDFSLSWKSPGCSKKICILGPSSAGRYCYRPGSYDQTEPCL